MFFFIFVFCTLYFIFTFIFSIYVFVFCIFLDHLSNLNWFTFYLGIAKKGPDGAYFFDRNPQLFSIILEFYRNNALIVPKNIPIEALHNELTYFGIDFDESGILF